MSRNPSSSIPSRPTWIWLASGIAALLLWFALVEAGVGGAFGAVVISDVADILISAIAAVATLIVAFRLRQSAPSAGRRWVLVGLASAAYTVGSIIWASYEIIARVQPPFPGWADVFYAIQYPLLAVGLVGAGMSYRGMLHVRKWGLIATLFSAVTCTILWVTVLGPSLAASAAPPLEKAASAFFPLADIILGIGPALFVLMVVNYFGAAKLGWPWMSVAFGVLLFMISDTVYAVQIMQGVFHSGTWLDYGWTAGLVFISFGALIAGDLSRTLDR